MNEKLSLGPFPLGINKVANETGLPKGAVRDCLNLDIDNDGYLISREGYTKVYEGVNCHSLYEEVFVEDGILKRVDNKNALMTGVGNEALSYCEIDGKIYFSNSQVHGILNQSFGLIPWGTDTFYDVPHRVQISPMPFGSLLFRFQGFLFAASGKYLYFSEGQNYEYTRLSENWFAFEDDITNACSVDNGVYVSTKNRTYFLAGEEPRHFVQRVVGEGSFKGQSTYVNPSDLGIDDIEYKIPVWVDNTGFVAGFLSGKILRLTDNRITFQAEGSFAMHYIEKPSIKQLLSSISGAPNDNYGASDKATVTIIRNGVTI